MAEIPGAERLELTEARLRRLAVRAPHLVELLRRLGITEAVAVIGSGRPNDCGPNGEPRSMIRFDDERLRRPDVVPPEVWAECDKQWWTAEPCLVFDGAGEARLDGETWDNVARDAYRESLVGLPKVTLVRLRDELFDQHRLVQDRLLELDSLGGADGAGVVVR